MSGDLGVHVYTTTADCRVHTSHLHCELTQLTIVGVTRGRRDVRADKDDIQRCLSSPPAPASLVSVSVWESGNVPSNSEEATLITIAEAPESNTGEWKTQRVSRSAAQSSRAFAMDATFSIVPLDDCGRSSVPIAGSALLPPFRCVALESMAYPGNYLDANDLGSMRSEPGGHILHPCEQSQEESSTWCLDVADGQRAVSFTLSSPAAPAYPLGSRILKGSDSKYLLVPIGQVIDEHYTTYFEFLGEPAPAPPPAVASA